MNRAFLISTAVAFGALSAFSGGGLIAAQRNPAGMPATAPLPAAQADVEAALSETSSSCQSLMNRVYQSGVANVDIFYGYVDTDSQDPPEYEGKVLTMAKHDLTVSLLTRDCPFFGGEEPCGFVPAQADPSLFVKKVGRGLFSSETVQVRINDDNPSPQDSDNKSNPQFKAASTAERTAFESAVNSGDVVFYSGHSRDGGGPDFTPAVRSANGNIDYPYYHKHQPGLHDLEKALVNSTAVIYGSFSCDSMDHWGEAICSADPHVIFLGSTRLVNFSITDGGNGQLIDSYDEGESSMMTALGAIIDRRCDFNQEFAADKDPFEAVTHN